MHHVDQFLSFRWEGYATHLSLETSVQISSNAPLNIQNVAHASLQEMSPKASPSPKNLDARLWCKETDPANYEAAHTLANLLETPLEVVAKNHENESTKTRIFGKRPYASINSDEDLEQKTKKHKPSSTTENAQSQDDEKNEILSKDLWSKKEDQLLREAVSFYQDQEKIQWSLITHQLPGKTSAQCRSHWMNKLKPRANTLPWTKEEDEQLILLAESNKKPRWIKIASELGTRRTNDQCRIRYNFLRKNKEGPIQWSGELDDLLKNLSVVYSSSGKTIPWAEVAKKMKSQIKGITGVDCRERWENHVNPDLNTSAWSKEEIDALKLVYNSVKKESTKVSWRLVAEKLNTRRSPEKCKSMYQALSQWTALTFPTYLSEKKTEKRPESDLV